MVYVGRHQMSFSDNSPTHSSPTCGSWGTGLPGKHMRRPRKWLEYTIMRICTYGSHQTNLKKQLWHRSECQKTKRCMRHHLENKGHMLGCYPKNKAWHPENCTCAKEPVFYLDILLHPLWKEWKPGLINIWQPLVDKDQIIRDLPCLLWSGLSP